MNVELKEVRIENYKSILDAKMTINDRINIIAGKNESGKTNILKALEAFSNDDFEEDSIPLGKLNENPTVEMNYVLKGEYLNDTLKLSLFNKEQYYTYNIIRSKRLFDKINGTVINEINEMLEKEISNVVYENMDVLREVFNNLDIDGFDINNEESIIIIVEYVAKYFDLQISNSFTEEVVWEEFYKHMGLTKEIIDNAVIIDSFKDSIKSKFKKVQDIVDKIKKINLIPTILYFSSFSDLLPDEINFKRLSEKEYIKNNKGFINLLRYLGVEVTDFIAEMNKDVRSSQGYLRNLSKSITGNFSDIYTQETIRITLERGGDTITINIFDKNDEVYAKKPSQRSQGFQWFLAFYLLINGKNCEKNSLILIDEPGLYLHAKAQDDILKYIENKIENQIIYTTHSPFLMDESNMHRVRLAINDRDNNLGTQIVDKYYALNDYDTITPLITAIGYNISKSPIGFGTGLNIITEGISDRYYLLAFMKLLGKETSNIHIIPSIGVGQIWYLVSIALGWNLNFKVLIDTDKNGRDAEKIIKKKLLIDDSDNIVYVKTEKDSTIESLFSTIDLDPEAKVNKALYSLRFYQKVESEAIKKEDLQTETIQNFEELFNKLGI